MFSSADVRGGLRIAALTLFPVAVLAAPVPQYHYGTTPTAAQIEAWNIDVRPDGEGLPPGKGTVDQGEKIFETKCSACHGIFGEGVGKYPKLNDPSMADLKGTPPTKTVGNYWPYATTIYDYVHRAMPFFAPQSLTPDEVYAVTAYILNLNNIVKGDFVADAETLPKVQMPNRHGFILKDPRPDTHDKECMKNCASASALTVTSTAAGKGITPPTTGPLGGDAQAK